MSRKSLFCLSLALAGLPVAGWAQVDMSAPPSDAAPVPEAPGGAERDPVITMFDNFSISLVAAQKCNPPSEETMTRFVQNLMIVQQITFTHFRKVLPDKSVDDITKMLNDRVESLDTIVNDAVQSKGCTDPSIQKMVEGFNVNAAMDFSKAP